MTSESSSKPSVAGQQGMVAGKGRRSGSQRPDVPWGVVFSLLVLIFELVIVDVLIYSAINLVGLFDRSTSVLLDGLSSGSPGISLAVSAVSAAITLLIIRLFLRRYPGAGWKTLGLRGFSFWRAVVFVGAILLGFIVLIGVILGLVALVFQGFNANEVQSNAFTESATKTPGIALIALVLIPPVIEETVFRGIVFPGFARRMGSVGGAIASSALFGAAHLNPALPGLQANVAVYTFVLGLLLCFLYTRLGSIIPGMVLHMLNNLIALYAMTAGQ